MKTLPSASTLAVTLPRLIGEAPVVQLRALPLGYRAMLDTVYPPPAVYENGKLVQADPPAEHQERKAYILLAESIVGDWATTTPKPTGSAKRIDWDRYAIDLCAEFNAAGVTQADLLALMTGFADVNRGAAEGNGDSPERRAG